MDWKVIMASMAIGAVTAGSIVETVTGEKYADGATKTTMQDDRVPELKLYRDKVSGDTLAVSDTAMNVATLIKDTQVKEEDVQVEIIPEERKRPELFKVNNFGGKPLVLIPGKKYHAQLDIDGKIIAEVEYTPDVRNYPLGYGNVLVGVMKFDVRPDKMGANADVDEVARLCGYTKPVVEEVPVEEIIP